MATVLIVDGHSAVFGIEQLASEHAANPRKARQMLVDWVNAYQDASDNAVVLVFDGRQAERTREGGTESEVMVLYSERGMTADTVIERIAGAQAKKHRVFVASNDRAVRESVMASGAEAFSIPHFAELLERSIADFRQKWGLEEG